ncbi:hypothetical protein RF11_15595 [Thelohanellus kitauei]|uniref:Uncharacterized protein n=1 Tax=Thelohanellus kitauei TaxID=669202 RepID=A0A0C2J7V4_THEKT|nr:hypothetical protein RF11_15595 [Thelohanellus kitauei]
MYAVFENLWAVLWSVLMLRCWPYDGPQVKTRLAMEDEIPEIYNTIHQDKCDKLEVIQNLHRPNYIFAVTKCSDGSGTEKGAIYKFNQSKKAFDLVELETSGGVSSLDKVIPTGDEMFCISYSKNISFLIDENLKIRRLEELVPNYEYYPHPDFSDSLIRFPKESKVRTASTYICRIEQNLTRPYSSVH